MSRRNVLAALIAIVVATLCFRLGFWQLERLAQRRALNDRVESRMRGDTVSLAQLPADSTRRFRLVRLSGTFDFDQELVLTGRSRDGSPGVHIITPLRRGPGARAVLVNRGWIYSPDAATARLEAWRAERDTVVIGYVDLFPPAAGPVRSQSHPRAWRRLDADTLRATLPYEVEPLVVVALAERLGGDSTPVRLPLPALGEGSHQSYAVQWFAFGVIALVGVGTLIWEDRRRQERNRPAT